MEQQKEGKTINNNDTTRTKHILGGRRIKEGGLKDKVKEKQNQMKEKSKMKEVGKSTRNVGMRRSGEVRGKK